MKRFYDTAGRALPIVLMPNGQVQNVPLGAGELAVSRLSVSELIAQGFPVIPASGAVAPVGLSGIETATYTPALNQNTAVPMHTTSVKKRDVCFDLIVNNRNGTDDINVLGFSGNNIRRYNLGLQAGYIGANNTVIGGTYGTETLNFMHQISSNNAMLVSKVTAYTENVQTQYDYFDGATLRHVEMAIDNTVIYDSLLSFRETDNNDDIAYRRDLEITTEKGEILFDGFVSMEHYVPKGKEVKFRYCVTLVNRSYPMMPVRRKCS